jgi:integrase
MPRRSYGTGALWAKTDKRGRETWYGQVRINGRIVKRALGPKRAAGSREGLTRAQAEKKLRSLIDSAVQPEPGDPTPIDVAGTEYLRHCRQRQLARTTLMDYESCIRVHLVPFFGDKPLSRIDERDVEEFMSSKLDAGKAPKSVTNWLGLLHSIFEFAIRRGWASDNPCKRVAKPKKRRRRLLRFLDGPELEAVLRAVPDDERGPTERCLYLVAAMTGLRPASSLVCAGATSTGLRRRSASVTTSSAASSVIQSRPVPIVRCRWQTALRRSSSCTSKARCIRVTTISSSCIPPPVRRSTSRGFASASSAR